MRKWKTSKTLIRITTDGITISITRDIPQNQKYYQEYHAGKSKEIK